MSLLGRLALPAAVAALALPPAAAPAPRACTAFAAVGTSTQLVTVDAPARDATSGTLRLWRRDGACWVAVAGPWRAELGRGGVARNRREGDGTTPLGTFAFGSVIYGVARDPGVRYRYHRLVCGDWWDEDPASPTYNTFRHVRCGTAPPFGGGSEALWRATRAYRHFAEIRFNTDPVVPGRGSAIFLHVSIGSPTNGCVALAPNRLVRVLRWLRPGSRPLIAIRLARGA